MLIKDLLGVHFAERRSSILTLINDCPLRIVRVPYSSSILEDETWAPWMFIDEVSDIVYLSIDYRPAGLSAAMLCDLGRVHCLLVRPANDHFENRRICLV